MKHLQTYINLSIFTFLFILASHACLAAAPLRDSTQIRSAWYKKLSVRAQYQYFRTCHHSRFDGGYAFADYDASPHFSIGIGIGYDFCVLHPDNGYNLRNVKVLPVVADFRYIPFPKWTISPFAMADLGYSTFLKYNQEDPAHLKNTIKMTDHGLYTFGGVGFLVKVSSKAAIYTTAGFTGMHMSFNNNDVNPRGLSNQFGVRVNLY